MPSSWERLYGFKRPGFGWGGRAWLAQSVEHATLDLGVLSLSAMWGIEITYKERERPGLVYFTSKWKCSLVFVLET